jgi:aspartate dehydrogenase
MRLGLIGFGNIATTLVGLLPASPVTQVTALVRPGSEERFREAAKGDLAIGTVDFVSSLEVLLAAAPELVVECAGHGAVAEHGPAVLAAGVDLITASVGALADDALHEALRTAAADAPARLILPSGAIGGLDILSALAPAGDLQVTYRGTKPPAAWKGSPAEKAIVLDEVAARTRFFSGTAREAARQYPKNANVVAALALAGAGFDRTRVELVADPAATGNSHAYTVVSPICRYDMEITATSSPGNPRTSATTVYSILAEIRRFAAARLRRAF